MKYFLTLLALIFIFPAQADTAKSIQFSNGDWEIVCDNTRTCRAAGYQSDEDELTLSVLLTRKAGPKQDVTVELMIGDTTDEQLPDAVEMKINQQSYGSIKLNSNNVTLLSNSQRDALLKALPKTSQIEFIHNQKIWRLSDSGATAVLLKMDEAQGRLDTPGALVRKGTQDEKNVLAEIATPVIIKAPTLPATAMTLSPEIIKSIEQVLDSSDCDYEDTDSPGLTIYPVNDHYWLASRPCWLAAYNAGSNYWLIKSTAPYEPILITDSATDYDQGVIFESHKGRGLGDCWSQKSWTWDGKSFVLTEESTTGMCKMVAAGGAWNLPSFVSQVQDAK